MRRFALYLVAGIMVVVAMDLIAPPAGLGLAVGAWSAHEQESESVLQSVNRTTKSDRLSVPKAIGKQQVPRNPPVVLVGCDPVFSPLSASARANFSGRCVA
jgi:hypothetical protein